MRKILNKEKIIELSNFPRYNNYSKEFCKTVTETEMEVQNDEFFKEN